MQVDSYASRNKVIAIGAAAILAMLVTLMLPPFRLLGSLTMETMSYPYLLIELFTAIISILVVAISYHSLAAEPYLARAKLLIFGFSVVAVCDLAHALTFPGQLGFVADGGVARTIYFRLMGRTVEIATLTAIASHIVLPGSRRHWLLAGILTCGLIGWFGITHIDWFPAVTRDGRQTPFKLGYEYALAALNVGTAAVLWRQAAANNSSDRYLLSCACVVVAAGNVVLAQYRSPWEFTFTFGQVFKIVAYALIYRAAFVQAIKMPHQLLQESERQLRNSQEQLKALSDNLPNGMVYQLATQPDSSRRFLFVSAGIKQLSMNTLSAADLLQDPSKLYSMLVAEDAATLQTTETSSAHSMSAFNLIVRMQIRHEKLRYLHMYAQPRKLPGDVTVWDGITIDVSERELIGAEMRRLNAELEHRVAARTAALTHANKSLESFSYIVAHDLRAPLRNIAGYTLALQQEYANRLDEYGRQLLNNIADSRETVSSLIDGILAVSLLEHASLQRKPVDLSELVTDIANDLSLAEPQREVQFMIQPGLIADVDPALMKNTLHNLLHNAWKFTATRAPAIIEFGVSTNNSSDSRTYFVRDNGVGFDPAEADHLFDMFRRLPAHGNVAGHGIGLASVRSIIANHGGTVWAEATPGKGAAFYFDLPTIIEYSPPTELARTPS